MPIRINFLAEQLAQEDQRRRDPVKRGYLLGVLLVGGVVFVFVFLQLKLWRMREEVALFDSKFKSIEQRYNQAVANQGRLKASNLRLASLDALARERLLLGGVLDAMQYVTLPQVALTEMRVNFNYKLLEPVKGATNAAGVVSSALPARVAESITMTLDARDAGAPGGEPGGLIDAYREKLQAQTYFKSNLPTVRMAGRSPLAIDAATGEKFVAFKLECGFTPKERTDKDR